MTALEQLRLYIQDNPADPADYIFTDGELLQILESSSDDVNVAASLCWLILAGSQARLAKKKTIGKFSVDLTALARECREQSMVFQKKADELPADGYVEWAVDLFTARQIALRGDAVD